MKYENIFINITITVFSWGNCSKMPCFFYRFLIRDSKKKNCQCKRDKGISLWGWRKLNNFPFHTGNSRFLHFSQLNHYQINSTKGIVDKYISTTGSSLRIFPIILWNPIRSVRDALHVIHAAITLFSTISVFSSLPPSTKLSDYF